MFFLRFSLLLFVLHKVNSSVLQDLSSSKPPQQVTSFNPPQQVASFNPSQQVRSFNPPQQVASSKPPQQVASFNPPQQVANFNPSQQVRSFNPPQQVTSFNPPQVTNYKPPHQVTSDTPPQEVTSSNPPQVSLDQDTVHKLLKSIFPTASITTENAEERTQQSTMYNQYLQNVNRNPSQQTSQNQQADKNIPMNEFRQPIREIPQRFCEHQLEGSHQTEQKLSTEQFPKRFQQRPLQNRSQQRATIVHQTAPVQETPSPELPSSESAHNVQPKANEKTTDQIQQHIQSILQNLENNSEYEKLKKPVQYTSNQENYQEKYKKGLDNLRDQLQNLKRIPPNLYQRSLLQRSEQTEIPGSEPNYYPPSPSFSAKNPQTAGSGTPPENQAQKVMSHFHPSWSHQNAQS